ncbi:hypothetical protein C8J57DRAFT_1479483 [Mycena rebaudengoi]|nr:hypothetical protein C8J57DRAFT_1479483 [Mycena rebaudengoi]
MRDEGNRGGRIEGCNRSQNIDGNHFHHGFRRSGKRRKQDPECYGCQTRLPDAVAIKNEQEAKATNATACGSTRGGKGEGLGEPRTEKEAAQERKEREAKEKAEKAQLLLRPRMSPLRSRRLRPASGSNPRLCRCPPSHRPCLRPFSSLPCVKLCPNSSSSNNNSSICTASALVEAAAIWEYGMFVWMPVSSVFKKTKTNLMPSLLPPFLSQFSTSWGEYRSSWANFGGSSLGPQLLKALSGAILDRFSWF